MNRRNHDTPGLTEYRLYSRWQMTAAELREAGACMDHVGLRMCAAEMERRGFQIETLACTDIDLAGALAMRSLATVFRIAARRGERDSWRITIYGTENLRSRIATKSLKPTTPVKPSRSP